MADLIYLISASLDGYVADENGNFDWGNPSDDAHLFFSDFQSSIGTVLNGRRMYETMRIWDSWDTAEMNEVELAFAEAWRASDKIVYSSTLESVTEARTSIERTFDPEAVRAMKDIADRDLSVAGPGLAAAAINAGLVDRYILRVIPVIVGGGNRALPDGVRVDLEIDATRRFDDGSVLLDYRVR